MARSQYQSGCLFVRGKRRKVWVARWREEVILADGSAGRVMRSVVLGPVVEIGGRREARRLLDAHLNPINQGQYRPEATMLFSKFVTECFEPGVLPTLKFCYAGDLFASAPQALDPAIWWSSFVRHFEGGSAAIPLE